MHEELHALESNGTWELTTFPKGKKAIGSKWVYNVKYMPSSEIERLKGRLVFKGDKQLNGKDYKHVFSVVAKFATVRVLIALVTIYGWNMHHVDINNAFLHGHIDEEIYMQPPKGYTRAKEGEVCKLKRSLYGLKHTSRA